MATFGEVVEQQGGAQAPRDTSALLRRALAAELARGAAELAAARSGYEQPVCVAMAPGAGTLLAVCPADPALRADPGRINERTWLLVAAAVGALVEAVEPGPPRAAADLALAAGSWEARLALAFPAANAEAGAAELAALAFADQVAGIDRLRATAAPLPRHVLEDAGDLRPPIGATHPLRIAEAVARLGARPAAGETPEDVEEAVLALLAPESAAARPHDDPDPGRRIARRILQRLDGMGKWGGYHTEFAHLARGFAGNDRAAAGEIGERLIGAGLLVQKRSVGQRHVFLNPRRVADIRALIDGGAVPPGLDLG